MRKRNIWNGFFEEGTQRLPAFANVEYEKLLLRYDLLHFLIVLPITFQVFLLRHGTAFVKVIVEAREKEIVEIVKKRNKRGREGNHRRKPREAIEASIPRLLRPARQNILCLGKFFLELVVHDVNRAVAASIEVRESLIPRDGPASDNAAMHFVHHVLSVQEVETVKAFVSERMKSKLKTICPRSGDTDADDFHVVRRQGGEIDGITVTFPVYRAAKVEWCRRTHG
mmetsp:Transcript_16326/g.42076  ORF Transcript_16326/g.42076 Transcript_16326/m.42076 type:complete len:226 (-) Transcript_16326:198-875(-)